MIESQQCTFIVLHLNWMVTYSWAPQMKLRIISLIKFFIKFIFGNNVCAYCTADYVSFLRTVWTNCFSYLVKLLLCGWLWMKKWNSCAGFYQLALILFEGNNFRTNIDVDGGDDCPVILHHMLLSIHKNQAKISGWVIIDNRSAEVYQSALQILLNFNFN